MSNENVLTRAAFEKLKKEVEDLKGPTRARIAEAIREAKSHGDLRENAAYHEAKLNQARLESRIADLEKTLQLAKIIEGGSEGDSAQMGAIIVLYDFDFEEEMKIKLVSSYEANPAEDLISISSPLGAAVMGKLPGDEATVEAPAGTQRYKIVSISF